MSRQNEYYLPQSVSTSVASSSLYSRQASRPRAVQPMSRPVVRTPCHRPPPSRFTSQTDLYDPLCRPRHAATTTRPCNNGVQTVPRTTDWNNSATNDHRSSANYPYDSCIAAITRQQVDSFMTRCQRPNRTTGRNIRQNPTVVWSRSSSICQYNLCA